ncbi:J domain-containing protein [Clostridium cellulovorans]|uniref:Heat shock protein DnaJ domain protein n=1 Tax=Clostridium cellulovorans (strain ATCC 35296 / DSM 3052 / OCM 3 / 743B) TaxID=573061 RepID=D9SUB9_CLOC7|nr:J domain-containing protein [Clostridium cellulovorans]ADL52874.1 heat shock protein DnaJ domain protein [Clostridium cellulovorans 743B]
MRNPYEVLEIKEGASMEEITRAYREIVKRYHPDQYGNNPLKDLAEEKLREANEAYETLKQRGSSSSSNRSNNNYSNNTSQSAGYSNDSYNFYNEVRMSIQRGQYEFALQRLNSWNNRDAEWNYLMGVCHMNRGWYDSGINYVTQAINMNPNNLEYRNTYSKMTNRNHNYRQSYSHRHHGHGGFCGNDDCCDTFCKIWALDTCCECMGGDCIDCL